MVNGNYRKLNINELEMVAGGVRVFCKTENANITEILDKINLAETNTEGIPRGDTFRVRV